MNDSDDLMPEGESGASEKSADDSAERLEFVLEHDPRGACLRLMGELDLATAPELDLVLAQLTADGHDRVLIDLSELQFMDSTGLGSIVRAHDNADANGNHVLVRLGKPQVRRLFEITGLLERLDIED
jgi:anti-sigma B factor antagonist